MPKEMLRVAFPSVDMKKEMFKIGNIVRHDMSKKPMNRVGATYARALKNAVRSSANLGFATGAVEEINDPRAVPREVGLGCNRRSGIRKVWTHPANNAGRSGIRIVPQLRCRPYCIRQRHCAANAIRNTGEAIAPAQEAVACAVDRGTTQEHAHAAREHGNQDRQSENVVAEKLSPW